MLLWWNLEFCLLSLFLFLNVWGNRFLGVCFLPHAKRNFLVKWFLIYSTGVVIESSQKTIVERIETFGENIIDGRTVTAQKIRLPPKVSLGHHGRHHHGRQAGSNGFWRRGKQQEEVFARRHSWRKKTSQAQTRRQACMQKWDIRMERQRNVGEKESKRERVRKKEKKNGTHKKYICRHFFLLRSPFSKLARGSPSLCAIEVHVRAGWHVLHVLGHRWRITMSKARWLAHLDGPPTNTRAFCRPAFRAEPDSRTVKAYFMQPANDFLIRTKF